MPCDIRPSGPLALACLAVTLGLADPAAGSGLCSALDLPVAQATPPPLAYQAFCATHPGECTMSGPTTWPWDDAVRVLLVGVTREVNAQVRFMTDLDSIGEEEDWRYPIRGHGDCEDMALEKRRRLVALGVPRAALTMAIVHHRAAVSSHAVLLAETTAGTWVLDSLNNELRCWDAAGYDYETRERPDGRWDRFDQSH